MGQLDDLKAAYLDAMRGLDRFTGPKLRAEAQRIWAIAARIDRLAPRFDWITFWRSAGMLPAMPSRPVPAEVATVPFVPVVEDWSDLDLG